MLDKHKEPNVKKIFIGIGAVAALLVVAAVLVLWQIDAIAREGIQRGTQRATGLRTTVSDVSLRLLRGTLDVQALQIDNPDGFETPCLLRVGGIDTGVSLVSLLGDPIEMTHLDLEGVEVYLEQRGVKTNIQVVMDRLKRPAPPPDQPPSPQPEPAPPGEPNAPGDEPPAPPAEAKRILVQRITIHGATAHVQGSVPGQEKQRYTVRLPEIVLTDITADTAQGVTVDELVRRVLPALLAATVKQSTGKVPAELLADFRNDMLGQIPPEARKLLEEAGIDEMLEPNRVLDQAEKTLTDGLLKRLQKPDRP